MERFEEICRRLFDPAEGVRGHLVARWLFLRALGGIYFSAFLALIFQAKGLIGTAGILPAAEYLQALHKLGVLGYWYAPTLLWFSGSNWWLMTICWVGLLAAALLAANVWPRGTLAICFVCFVSFVGAARDFSGYQSDGMLLEAGFLALFVAPKGWRPGWGAASRGVLAAYLLLIWEWFRIYFESGLVKLDSGDPTWRNLTAMYEYYQNGPLPTWIGWYLQHLPWWFHRATAGVTLAMELVLVWLVFAGRRGRIVCCVVVTVWQIGVIASANYAFLNYLVLALAVLLLDDRTLRRWAPAVEGRAAESEVSAWAWAAGGVLAWCFYATAVPLAHMAMPFEPLPEAPVEMLEPLRIANTYGLFAVMTPHRYEIEFQGSNDGRTWTAYPFRFKPQDVMARPGIYAPYQPRFEWNLWFASLGTWERNEMVPRTQELLLSGDKDVLGLFAEDPFGAGPPKYVRAAIWQYWFTSWEEKRNTGAWWRREEVGIYAPTLMRTEDGKFEAMEDVSWTGPEM